MPDKANYSWKILNFIVRRFFQKMNLLNTYWKPKNLDGVISMKNQEEPQEKCSSTTKTSQNLQRQQQQHVLHERNSCHSQPQFEHEIFQPNIRPHNTKSSRPEVFCVFRNFGKFTGKHLCQRLSFNKVTGLNLQIY